MRIKENLQLKKNNEDLMKRLQEAEEETKKVLQQKMEVDEQMLKLMEVPGGQDANEEKPKMVKVAEGEDDDKKKRRKEATEDEDSEDLSVCITFLSFLLSCWIAFQF